MQQTQIKPQIGSPSHPPCAREAAVRCSPIGRDRSHMTRPLAPSSLLPPRAPPERGSGDAARARAARARPAFAASRPRFPLPASLPPMVSSHLPAPSPSQASAQAGVRFGVRTRVRSVGKYLRLRSPLLSFPLMTSLASVARARPNARHSRINGPHMRLPRTQKPFY